ncbi:uncharacterized protein LOC127839665 [Dreissena polymorpha]|uniref:uncharacterized protein LOC127839665 n=1 Tax=Dreissena polymorpha TaxID=45954 RepID=UPI0022651564|nr:uncharacterized protein LOC127839665 [Dreissena polymorpha]
MGQCEFPTQLQNKVMNSTYATFNGVAFSTSSAPLVFTNINDTWNCYSNDGSNIIFRTQKNSSITISGISFVTHYYLCIHYEIQKEESILFYVISADPAFSTDYVPIINGNLSDSFCSKSVDKAAYHILYNKANIVSAQTTCVEPLIGTFEYGCIGSANETGTIDVCANQTQLKINDTFCSTQSTLKSGSYYCIANTSETVSSGGTFHYQTIYNPSTDIFTCLSATGNTSSRVYFTKTSTTTGRCTSSQSPLNGYNLTVLTPTPVDNGQNLGLIIGLAVGLSALLLLIVGAVLFYFCVYKKDPNAGKPIVENTKPRFEDPDKEDILQDLEVETARSTPVTRDEVTFEAVSPSFISNGKVANGHVKSFSPEGGFSAHQTSSRRDSGIGSTEKSTFGSRPTPRIGLNASKESMVIFNGDEKVISGNDTRIVPNTNPNPRVFHMENFVTGEGPLTLQGLEDEEGDQLAELSPGVNKDSLPYPSLPREKSNLMPPIETADPEKEKD